MSMSAHISIMAAVYCRMKQKELKSSPKHRKAATLIHGLEEYRWMNHTTFAA